MRQGVIRRWAAMAAATALAGGGLVVSPAAAGAGMQSIDQILGAAGPAGAGAPWTMISEGNFTANGPGTNNGNMAVASGTATLTTPFSVNGTVYLGAGVSNQSNVTPTGGYVSDPSLVSQAASDARTAASTFSGMTATQTVGTLGNNSSITASASNNWNVIDASGVNITNGPLTLIGTSSSVFVINVAGDFSVSNGGIVLQGGVSESNVVWNISGNLTITGGGGGGATFYGFGLDPNGTVTVHDDIWNGEIIGGTITDTSGFTVNSPPAPKMGLLEICKQQAASGLAHDVFTFTAAGHTVVVPVGGCSPAFAVPPGHVRVTEVGQPGSKLVAVATSPASRLVKKNLAARTAVVKVLAGGTTTTIVTFTNREIKAQDLLQICQVAGTGIAVGTSFSFTAGPATVSVPAGPAPSGYCVAAGVFSAGHQTISQMIPAGDQVTSITTRPANRQVSVNVPAGQVTVNIGPDDTRVTYTDAS